MVKKRKPLTPVAEIKMEEVEPGSRGRALIVEPDHYNLGLVTAVARINGFNVDYATSYFEAKRRLGIHEAITLIIANYSIAKRSDPSVPYDSIPELNGELSSDRGYGCSPDLLRRPGLGLELARQHRKVREMGVGAWQRDMGIIIYTDGEREIEGGIEFCHMNPFDFDTLNTLLKNEKYLPEINQSRRTG
jgi:hypothetical protein